MWEAESQMDFYTEGDFHMEDIDEKSEEIKMDITDKLNKTILI